MNICWSHAKQCLAPVIVLVTCNLSYCALPLCPSESAKRSRVKCADIAFHHKFRTLDATCNNLRNWDYGSASTPMVRLLPPKYEDDIDMPIGAGNVTYHGFELVNPRKISQALLTSQVVSDDIRHTAMLAHFGQFIAHDMSLAMENKTDCSSGTIETPHTCFSIRVPKDDHKLNTVAKEMPFKRTESCRLAGRREQMNRVSAFLDSSQIYGSSELTALRLRQISPVDKGKLKENRYFRSPEDRGYMIFDESDKMTCFNNRSKSSMDCFQSGDIRANEQLMLASLHTVFNREHNRIAEQLGRINPGWDGETIFQETRRIVGAVEQHITYTHWLPKILGPVGMKALGSYKGYSDRVNPGIANSVASAALRFGHTIMVPSLKRLDPTFRPDEKLEEVLLRDAFFSPQTIIHEGGIEPLIRGAIASPVKDIRPESMINSELTDHLFPSALKFPQDLAALNLQRGRDHALPPYNEWRKLCGLEKLTSWAQFMPESRDVRHVEALARLYHHPDNIDLWVGGLLERPLRGAKLGRTFTCLLADQFKRLREGDRLWYENAGVFGEGQLNSIKAYSLSRILCNNLDESVWIPKDVFVYYPFTVRQFVRCEQIEDLDLSLWKVEENGYAESVVCAFRDCTCKYKLGRWEECDGSNRRQSRRDFLVEGPFPPCTPDRIIYRRCSSSSSAATRRRFRIIEK